MRHLIVGITAMGLFAACAGGPPDTSQTEDDSTAMTVAQCDYAPFRDNQGKVPICHYNPSGRRWKYILSKVTPVECRAHLVHAGAPRPDYVAYGDRDCDGDGCLPPSAPCDATVPCCDGLTCQAGVCTEVNACATNACDANQVCTDQPYPADEDARSCACAAGFEIAADDDDDDDDHHGNGHHGDDDHDDDADEGGGHGDDDHDDDADEGGHGGHGDHDLVCVDIDECATGAAGCAANATCTNTPGGYTCTCPGGTSGDGHTCVAACPPGFARNLAGVCTDIDECAADTDDCAANATCTNNAGGFTCACNAGYAGDGVTCADVDECATGTVDCGPVATCANTVGGFTCACNAGYAADAHGVCTNVNECLAGTHTCAAQADCHDTDGSFTCTCRPGFAGDGFACADVDECAAGTDDCAATAACTNTVGGFTCACNAGYIGNGTSCGPICGDGIVVAGEACDDGNLAAGDGCSPVCSLEPRCGDGHVDPGEACDDGNGNDADACTNTCTVPAAGPPAGVAVPSATRFMWQGVQETVGAGGQACTGVVTAGMGDQALCYTAASGALMCAGRVFETVWGPTFVDTGLRDVEQVFISPTFNAENGNAMCVKKTDGTIWCMGNHNNAIFGFGSPETSSTFVQWGGSSDIHRMATGTWDQLCALHTDGRVDCSGADIGGSYHAPVLQDGGAPHTTLWATTFGTVALDDPGVFRAQYGRSECQVTAGGLRCGGTLAGPAGAVVDGGQVQDFGSTCYLDSSSRVFCAGGCQGGPICGMFDATMCQAFGAGFGCQLAPPAQHFASRPVVLFVHNPYAGAFCGVHNDGSLACFGDNDRQGQGMLGTGGTGNLGGDTIVAPPGSVRLPACP